MGCVSEGRGASNRVILEWYNLIISVIDSGVRRVIFKSSFGRIESGRLTAFVGPSGCGKTLLLRALSGRLPPQYRATGWTLINGHVIDSRTADKITMIGRDGYSIDHYSVKRFAELYLDGRNRLVSSEELESDIDGMFDVFKIRGLSTVAVGKLAPDERQRLMLAIGLLSGDRIIFIDDTTVGISMQISINILKSLSMFARARNAIIVTALRQSDQCILDIVDDALYICDRCTIVSRKGDKTNFEVRGPTPLPDSVTDEFLLFEFKECACPELYSKSNARKVITCDTSLKVISNAIIRHFTSIFHEGARIQCHIPVLVSSVLTAYLTVRSVRSDKESLKSRDFNRYRELSFSRQCVAELFEQRTRIGVGSPERTRMSALYEVMCIACVIPITYSAIVFGRINFNLLEIGMRFYSVVEYILSMTVVAFMIHVAVLAIFVLTLAVCVRSAELALLSTVASILSFPVMLSFISAINLVSPFPWLISTLIGCVATVSNRIYMLHDELQRGAEDRNVKTSARYRILAILMWMYRTTPLALVKFMRDTVTYTGRDECMNILKRINSSLDEIGVFLTSVYNEVTSDGKDNQISRIGGDFGDYNMIPTLWDIDFTGMGITEMAQKMIELRDFVLTMKKRFFFLNTVRPNSADLVCPIVSSIITWLLIPLFIGLKVNF